MMVRCPFCYRSFPHEEHPLSTKQCPDCSRQFYPSNPEAIRCPMCEEKWAEFIARGGVVKPLEETPGISPEQTKGKEGS